jgi:hypothetical protein
MPATSSAGTSSKTMLLAATIPARTRHRHFLPRTRQQPTHQSPADSAPRQSLRPLQTTAVARSYPDDLRAVDQIIGAGASHSDSATGHADIFRFSGRVTRYWCQIQLTITTAMHRDSLSRMTIDLGNALLSACRIGRCGGVLNDAGRADRGAPSCGRCGRRRLRRQPIWSGLRLVPPAVTEPSRKPYPVRADARAHWRPAQTG